jgi:hypothetical protein
VSRSVIVFIFSDGEQRYDDFILVVQFGTTPLMMAVSNCRPECVRILLEVGADLEAKTNVHDQPIVQGGDTALIISARCGSSDCMRLLLKAGSEIEAKNAVRYGRILHLKLAFVLVFDSVCQTLGFPFRFTRQYRSRSAEKRLWFMLPGQATRTACVFLFRPGLIWMQRRMCEHVFNPDFFYFHFSLMLTCFI